ncbi:hypothetical protein [Paraburkholderia sp. LEh10]|uniref:hypothetical protein n=1 Tax=Paraburkholderia sp. LEh10 TaxID=2821353 RepID=UPI0028ACFF2D|nr:hypothetical protein [Paraburkholderia sp. LEh10]
MRDDFVVLEWVTWQFAESLQEGAKREVPKIGNLHGYRAMLAPPHVKRRLVCEPDVSRYIQIDPPVVTTHTVDWDSQHWRSIWRPTSSQTGIGAHAVTRKPATS